MGLLDDLKAAASDLIAAKADAEVQNILDSNKTPLPVQIAPVYANVQVPQALAGVSPTLLFLGAGATIVSAFLIFKKIKA